MKNVLMIAIAIGFLLMAEKVNSQATLSAPASVAPASGGCYTGIGINNKKPDFPMDIIGAGVRINEYSLDRCIRIKGYQYSGGSPLSASILWDGSNVPGCTTDFVIGGPGNVPGAGLGYYTFNIQKSSSLDSAHHCGDTLRYGFLTAAAVYGYDDAGYRPGSFQFYNNVLVDNTAHDGLVGIGTTAPSTQLHTTGGVRFQGVAAQAQGTDTKFLTIDANGNVHWKTPAYVSSTCATVNFIPKTTGTNTQGCSEILDNGTSVGIGTTGSFTYSTNPQVQGSTGVPSSGTVKLDVNGVARALAYIATSDATQKTNIHAINDALSKVMLLNGKTYYWNANAIKEHGADNSRQIGFLAQEVESVLPEAVIKDGNGMYGMNYNMIIPVLAEAIKELNGKIVETQQENADLKAQNAALQNQINDLCNGGCASFKSNSNGDQQSNQLLQNVPNPFSQSTNIGYVINAGTIAYMNINSLDGKVIKHISLGTNGAGTVTVNSSDMAPGTYTYTLVVDTKVVDTKIMVITAQD